jgi:NADPH:quinone reductase-like Zn-dependent oxidoreductase
MNTTEMTRPVQPVPRPTIGRLRLRPTLRGRGFVVGVVDAAGPDTNGFAPRDRVAWRDTSKQGAWRDTSKQDAWRDTSTDLEIGQLLLMDQDDVLGVPSWITDEQVVSYLGAGLIARALVRTRPFVRGDEVRVESTDPLVAEMTAAWAKSLGANVVDRAAVAIQDEPRVRRTVLGSHGKLAQAAVEVFQAIRAGVFDGVGETWGKAA